MFISDRFILSFTVKYDMLEIICLDHFFKFEYAIISLLNDLYLNQ